MLVMSDTKLIMKITRTVPIILILLLASVVSGAVTPTPLISRGKTVYSNISSTTSLLINDGNYLSYWEPGLVSPSSPAWIAINTGGGYSRVLLTWYCERTYNYRTDDKCLVKWGYSWWRGMPVSFKIQASADSTNGADGIWSEVASSTCNYFNSREHSFDFTGMKWVRYEVDESSSADNSGPLVSEIDVYDISNGCEDSVIFMGDSITAAAFRRTPYVQPCYSVDIQNSHPAYFPAMIEGGISWDMASRAVTYMDENLSLNPDMKYWCLGYGTNGMSGTTPAQFTVIMQTMIDKIKAAGKIPVLARIPYTEDPLRPNVPLYNVVIDSLQASNNLIQGADLYGWFQSHPE